MRRVDTTEGYLSWADGVKTAGTKLFRGQTKQYGQIVPSLYRGQDRPENAHDLIFDIYRKAYEFGHYASISEPEPEIDEEEDYGTPVNMFTSWSFTPFVDLQELGPGEIAGFGGAGPRSRAELVAWIDFGIESRLARHCDALLQHYGVPSPGLDISYDPLIALWFATHPFRIASPHTVLHDGHMEGDGIVYVFDGDRADLEAQDLRDVYDYTYAPWKISIPYYGLRGVVQQGGLLFASTPDKPDVSDFVVDACLIAPGTWEAVPEGLTVPAYRDLMPPVSRDPFYRMLLEEKKSPDSEFAPLLASVREYFYPGEGRAG